MSNDTLTTYLQLQQQLQDAATSGDLDHYLSLLTSTHSQLVALEQELANQGIELVTLEIEVG